MFTQSKNIIVILILCGAIFSLANAFQFLKSANEKQAQPLADDTAKLQQQIDILKKENDALLKENKLLNLKLSSISNTANHPQIEAHSKETSQPSSNQYDAQELKAEIYKQKSEGFSRWLNDSIKNSSSFDLGKEMRQRFDSEAPDNNWAPLEENKLTNYFSDIPELAGIALRETKCRSTQCQILISTSDVNQANELVMTLSKVLQEKNNTSMVIAAPDTQKNLTTIYVARDEKGFELH